MLMFYANAVSQPNHFKYKILPYRLVNIGAVGSQNWNTFMVPLLNCYCQSCQTPLINTIWPQVEKKNILRGEMQTLTSSYLHGEIHISTVSHETRDTLVMSHPRSHHQRCLAMLLIKMKQLIKSMPIYWRHAQSVSKNTLPVVLMSAPLHSNDMHSRCPLLAAIIRAVSPPC